MKTLDPKEKQKIEGGFFKASVSNISLPKSPNTCIYPKAPNFPLSELTAIETLTVQGGFIWIPWSAVEAIKEYIDSLEPTLPEFPVIRW